jgi:hypothetical protein
LLSALCEVNQHGFKTTSTDPLGRTFTTMSNALGQTLWTQDTNNQRMDFIEV